MKPHTGVSPALDEIIIVTSKLLRLAQGYYDKGETDRATETLRFLDETFV